MRKLLICILFFWVGSANAGDPMLDMAHVGLLKEFNLCQVSNQTLYLRSNAVEIKIENELFKLKLKDVIGEHDLAIIEIDDIVRNVTFDEYTEFKIPKNIYTSSFKKLSLRLTDISSDKETVTLEIRSGCGISHSNKTPSFPGYIWANVDLKKPLDNIPHVITVDLGTHNKDYFEAVEVNLFPCSNPLVLNDNGDDGDLWVNDGIYTGKFAVDNCEVSPFFDNDNIYHISDVTLQSGSSIKHYSEDLNSLNFVNFYLHDYNEEEEIFEQAEKNGVTFTFFSPKEYADEAHNEVLWWVNCYPVIQDITSIYSPYTDIVIRTGTEGYTNLSTGNRLHMIATDGDYESYFAETETFVEGTCDILPQGIGAMGGNSTVRSHEFLHTFVARRLPSWFNEGLAVYIGQKASSNGYQPLICSEGGYSKNNFGPGADETHPYTSDEEGYQSGYCFWVKYMEEFGYEKFQKAMQMIEQKIPQGSVGSVPTIQKFVDGVLTPATGYDMKKYLIDNFNFTELLFYKNSIDKIYNTTKFIHHI